MLVVAPFARELLMTYKLVGIVVLIKMCQGSVVIVVVVDGTS